MQQTNRIWFLQLARAIACILIVFVHWETFIFNPNALVGNILQGPLVAFPHVSWTTNLFGVIPEPFREVYFSLGLFFLISGYVIPLSMEKSHPVAFIVRRFMRIYPTLLVCTLITAAVICLGRAFDGLAWNAISMHTLTSNLLMVRDVFHQPFVENATWTLEIEVHFYFICFLLAFFNGQRRAWVLTGIALGLLLMQYWLDHHVAAAALPESITLNVSYISFMFIGTCFYNWQRQYWSGKKLFVTVIALLVINNHLLAWSPLPVDVANAIYENDVYAIFGFILLMLLNDRLPYSKWLDKIAEISYPLYLVHGFTGYVFFFIAFKMTHSLLASVAVAAILVGFISVLVHRFVEMPGIRLAKQMLAFFASKKRDEEMAVLKPAT